MLMSKCEKCDDKDHEGFFCRCEMRNIEVAKELRKNNQSPWTITEIDFNAMHRDPLEIPEVEE